MWEQARQLSDNFSLWKIDRLTELARRVLPPGYWGAECDSKGRPMACLTFDDGPDPSTTPALLEILEQAGVKATFFLIGGHAARYPDLVLSIMNAGHSVGSHSYSHRVLPLLSGKMLQQEIDQTNDRLQEITGQRPRFFRPPYGLMDSRAGELLAQRQMLPVYWGCVPEDWQAPGADSVVLRVMKRLSHGNLVVLHERACIAQQTLCAVKQIIPLAREQGVQFVGIPELIALS